MLTTELREKLIGMAAAARLFGNAGRGGRCPHPSTPARYVQKGSRLPDGTWLKLKAVRVGGRWATTEKWVQEFIAAMTEAHLPAAPTAPRTPAERERDVAAANATLALLGV